MRRTVTLIIVMGLAFSVYSQDVATFGFLPSVNVKKKLGNEWKMNGKVQSRFQFFDVQEKEDAEYLLTDIALIASKGTGLNNSFSVGYLIRLENGNIIHRTIEQYTMVRRYNSFRLSHRYTADQTFNEVDSPSFRLRYRITPEIALNGLDVNEKEFYYKGGIEILHELQSGSYELEFRATPFVGYQVSKSQQLEVGLDYRISSFFEAGTTQRFWWAVNWYLAL